MRFRRLGSSDISVSEISLGCCTMGGLNWVNGVSNGWATVDEDEITAAVKFAVDRGVNHFDNADQYGNGNAERMLARVFKRLGLDSRKFIIASKVGHFHGTAEHAYEPAHIRHQCEQSLINLQRDYIDLYYFHHENFGENDRYLAGAVEVMDRLVKEGKVRIKGQSAHSAAAFSRLVPVVRPQVLQGVASILRDEMIRPGSLLSELMEWHQLTYVGYSPLAKGRLLDKFNPAQMEFDPGDTRSEDKEFSSEAIAALKPKLAKLKARFGASTEDLAAVAFNYVLAQPRVACVIPGFRNERQVRSNLSVTDRVLSPDDLEYIRTAMLTVQPTGSGSPSRCAAITARSRPEMPAEQPAQS